MHVFTSTSYVSVCDKMMDLFKEPTVVKKATPEAPSPTVVLPEQKVSPPSRGRVSIAMSFVGFFGELNCSLFLSEISF